MILETKDAEKLFQQFKHGGIDLIHQLKEAGATEGEILDFKRAQNNSHPPGPKDQGNLARAISGFANSDGGVLVWGVDCAGDKDCVTGLCEIDKVDQFRAAIFNQCNQLVKPKVRGIQAITIYSDESKSKGFVIIFIPKCKHVIESISKLAKGFYERVNASFEEISAERLRDKVLHQSRLKPLVLIAICTLIMAITGAWLWIGFFKPPPDWKYKTPKTLAEAKQLYQPYVAIDSEAQVRLGCAYYFEDNDPINKHKAAQLFEKAANSGNALAQYNLGCMYCYGEIGGIGKTESLQKALALFKTSQNNGARIAATALGWTLLYKKKLEFYEKFGATSEPIWYDSAPKGFFNSTLEEASKNFKLAADHGDAMAYCLWANMLRHRSVEQWYHPDHEVINLYQKSYELGSPLAAWRLSVLVETDDRFFYTEDNYHEQIDWLTEAATLTSFAERHPTAKKIHPLPEAKYNLGLAYEYGITKNTEKAYMQYQSAAEDGLQIARLKVAELDLLDPARVKKARDTYEALILEHPVDSKVFVPATNNLGIILWSHPKNRKDNTLQASQLFTQACISSHFDGPIPIYNLAYAYAHGFGGSPGNKTNAEKVAAKYKGEFHLFQWYDKKFSGKPVLMAVSKEPLGLSPTSHQYEDEGPPVLRDLNLVGQ